LATISGGFAIADHYQPQGDVFLTFANLQNLATQTAPVLVAGLGMTLIIIAGGIDLSVGSMVALAAMALGLALERGWSPAASVAASLATGFIAGLFNGLLVSRLKIVPFVVTLGTMTIYLGLAKLSNNSAPVRPDQELIPEWLKKFDTPQPPPGWWMFPPGVWLAILLALVAAALLRFTIWGRYAYAIGSNERAAYLSGINVVRVKTLIYAVAGICFGLTGVYQFSRLSGQGSPTEGQGMELRVIAAVVVGGASLSGGRGTIWGTICGAATMAVVKTGCDLLEISNPIQDVTIGVIVIAAVAMDRLRPKEG